MSLDLQQTLTCGQCFRFSENNGQWTVISGVDENVKSLTLTQYNIDIINKDPFWSHYFDMETDYEALVRHFSNLSPVLAEACAYAPGIHILNQDKWEALCSFVISQNNNIKRIMGIVSRLSQNYGKKNSDGISGFPSPETIVSLSEDQLRAVGLGFRAEYVKNTAEAVINGLLEELDKMDVEEARAEMMKIKGIGPKVANCALLFGCHRLECFPMDVWMKKVMATYFPGKDGSMFGEYAGVAQQYLFNWMRNSEENK